MGIKTFRDLLIWQKGMELVKAIYKLTRSFPKSEDYNLSSQMKRASISIPSNIAEGFGRSTKKDFQRFLYIALGSIFELQTQIIISYEQNYINQQQYDSLNELTREVERMLCSFMNSNRNIIDQKK
ncbi:MAG: four helix bundle protein [Candidatus Cloacimonadota bacterium]|nr:four helix bundle protein [Candidatus Cloacimonadota bacterium]